MHEDARLVEARLARFVTDRIEPAVRRAPVPVADRPDRVRSLERMLDCSLASSGARTASRRSSRSGTGRESSRP